MTVRNPLIWHATYTSELPSGDQMQFPIGAVGAPGIVFRGAATSGFYYDSPAIKVSIGGVLVAAFSSAGLDVTGHVNASGNVGAVDVNASGHVAAGGNVTGLLILTNYAVGSLPGSPPDGATAFVTNANETWANVGTAPTAGGGNKLPVYAAGGVWLIG